MKDISKYIVVNEAKAKAPSAIKSYKGGSKAQKVHFLGSDIYDTNDPGYDDYVKYYSGTGNGYIMDKDGKVYDVKCGSYSSDAGRIAAGTMNYSATIYKVLGKYDLHFHGYCGVFSNPSSETWASIESDLENGAWLENYVAKHKGDLDYNMKNNADIKALISKGDPNASTMKDEKAAKKEQKKQEFYTRYVILPDTIEFRMTPDGPKASQYGLVPEQIKKNAEDLRAKLKAEYKGDVDWMFSDEYKESYKKANKLMQDYVDNLLGDSITSFLRTVFKTANLSDYSGICLDVSLGNTYNVKTAIDSKTHKLVSVDTDKNKIIGDDPTISIINNVIIWKSNCSEKSLALFKKVSDAYKKLNSRKQSEYIENTYLDIWQRSNEYVYARITKKKARELAKKKFQRMMKDHDFDSNDRIGFTWEMIADYLEGDMPEKPEKISETPIIKDPKGPAKVMSKKAQSEASAKMDAWHNGTRNQNLKSCSDAKLKMNYAICKDKGYEPEMKKIEDEAKSRGIVLEKFSLREYMYFSRNILS